MEGPAQYQTRVIKQFLDSVADVNNPRYGRQYLADLLKPSLTLEGLIRVSFLLGKPWDAQSMDPYFGMFDVFRIPTHLRVTYARESTAPIVSHADFESQLARDNDSERTHFSYYSEAAQALCSFSREYMFPLFPDERRTSGNPCMVGSLEEYRNNFVTFTQGALESLSQSDWRNMVVTGGAVVASLRGCTPHSNAQSIEVAMAELFDDNSQYGQSGVDIIFYGLTAEEVSSLPSLSPVIDLNLL